MAGRSAATKQIVKLGPQGRGLDIKRVRQSLAPKNWCLKQGAKVKEARGCLYCSETDPVALDFHHREPELKSFNLSNPPTGITVGTWEDEVDKCDVLCANCHRKLHAGRSLKARK